MICSTNDASKLYKHRQARMQRNSENCRSASLFIKVHCSNGLTPRTSREQPLKSSESCCTKLAVATRSTAMHRIALLFIPVTEFVGGRLRLLCRSSYFSEQCTMQTSATTITTIQIRRTRCESTGTLLVCFSLL